MDDEGTALALATEALRLRGGTTLAVGTAAAAGVGAATVVVVEALVWVARVAAADAAARPVHSSKWHCRSVIYPLTEQLHRTQR